MKNKIIFSVLFLMFTVLGARAQNPDAELKDVEIEIVKDREIVLPKASRNFEKVPPSSVERRADDLEYFFNSIHFQLPLLDIKMRPLRIRDPRLEKTYGNYVRAGLGNYGATYLEGYLNSKRNKDYSYGAHVNFENYAKGPVEGKNSSSGDFELDLFGKYFTPSVTFGGEIGYDQRGRKYYGATDVTEGMAIAEKQSWKTFHLRGTAENTDKESVVDYLLDMSFSNLTDKYDASESEFAINAKTGFKITEAFDVRINGDLYLIGRKDSEIDKLSRNLFRINPTVGFEYEGFRIRAGFRGVFENDTIAGFNKFHIYPDAVASYTFNEKIDLYAGIGGDIEKNTLHRFASENPFIAANVPIFHGNKTFELYGGLKGRLSPKLGFEAGFSASNVKNLYFYLNDTTAQEKFNVIYDNGNTAVVNLFGSLAFIQEQQWRINVRGDYWGYGTSDIREAWHRPNYKLTGAVYYNLFDKINLNAEVYTMGGIKAYDFTNNETVNLKAIFDLNFMAEYLVSERFSAFVELNNIFSKNYEQLYRYPVRGFQFMVGASYTF